MKEKTVKLGECIELSSGRFLPQKNMIAGDYSVYGGNGVNGKHNDFFLLNETLIIGRVGAYCGCVHITEPKSWITDNALYVTNFRLNADLKYLYYLLNYKNLNQYANVSGQPSISQSSLLEIEIPFPGIEVQKSTSLILDIVSNNIKLRKRQIEACDELIKGLFYEMFGKYLTRKEYIKLDEVSTKITDGEHGTVERFENGVLYLMARNITKYNQLDFSEVSYIDNETHRKINSRCNPEYEDIMVVCVGATIGKVVLVPLMEKFSIARSIALIKYSREIFTGRFLLSLFNSDFMQRQLALSSNESAQAGLYIGKIKDLNVITPPIELQNNFSNKVEKIAQQKSLLQQSLSEMEDNFNVIMQKAFKGELFSED